MSIAQRLEALEADLRGACARAGRAREEVTLVAVSKTFPVEAIREAYAAGIRNFGENRVQELDLKASALSDLDLRWHLVGSLQTNKVGRVARWRPVIHSLDRDSLRAALGRAAGPDHPIEVLVQVNTTGEASKSGLHPEEVPALAREVQRTSGLLLRGLMTIGPTRGTEAETRAAFSTLRRLRDACRLALPGASMDVLSMGMSDDFEIAVEEGATHLRIGSRLFGHRDPPLLAAPLDPRVP